MRGQLIFLCDFIGFFLTIQENADLWGESADVSKKFDVRNSLLVKIKG